MLTSAEEIAQIKDIEAKLSRPDPNKIFETIIERINDESELESKHQDVMNLVNRTPKTVYQINKDGKWKVLPILDEQQIQELQEISKTREILKSDEDENINKLITDLIQDAKQLHLDYVYLKNLYLDEKKLNEDLKEINTQTAIESTDKKILEPIQETKSSSVKIDNDLTKQDYRNIKYQIFKLIREELKNENSGTTQNSPNPTLDSEDINKIKKLVGELTNRPDLPRNSESKNIFNKIIDSTIDRYQAVKDSVKGKKTTKEERQNKRDFKNMPDDFKNKIDDIKSKMKKNVKLDENKKDPYMKIKPSINRFP